MNKEKGRDEFSNLYLDPNRQVRTGIPEVVFSKGKDDGSLLKATGALLEKNGRVLLTKCSESQIRVLRDKFPDKVRISDRVAGVVVISEEEKSAVNPGRDTVGSIAVISAGSSDYFVAEEAAVSAEFLGLTVIRCYDCGIAGMHRVDRAVREIEEREVDGVVVVAGMEGALPSIIAGFIERPIVAIPTSIGYGTGLGGISALLTMLNTCSPGISVVNIDNGFGAAAFMSKAIRHLKAD